MAAQQPASPAPMTSTSHFAVSAMSPSGMSSGRRAPAPRALRHALRVEVEYLVLGRSGGALPEAGAPPWLAGAHPASAPPAMPAPASVDPIRNCLRDNDLFCVFFPMLMVPSCSGPALARSGSPANGAAVRSRSPNMVARVPQCAPLPDAPALRFVARRRVRSPTRAADASTIGWRGGGASPISRVVWAILGKIPQLGGGIRTALSAHDGPASRRGPHRPRPRGRSMRL